MTVESDLLAEEQLIWYRWLSLTSQMKSKIHLEENEVVAGITALPNKASAEAFEASLKTWARYNGQVVLTDEEALDLPKLISLFELGKIIDMPILFRSLHPEHSMVTKKITNHSKEIHSIYVTIARLAPGSPLIRDVLRFKM